MKVLIAEDDLTSRRVLELLMKKWGYDVISACDGKEAWELLQQTEGVRMAVLDWIMPVKSGVDLCRHIRNERKYDSLYILMLTSKDSSKDIVEAFDAGADDYVSKPYKSEVLAARIKAGARIISLQSRFLQSRKMEAIGQLAGGVAHEFNNILGGIVGNADLLKMKVESDKKLIRYVDKITNAALKASDLTRQLLSFARKKRIEMQFIDIHNLINRMITTLQHTIDKRIKMQSNLLAETFTVKGDLREIQTVLLNLTMNALDAMPEGGMLTFETETLSLDKESLPDETFDVHPGTYVKIKVVDTGVGMDGDTVKKIFEPFFTTKEIGSGTGLGLASVYGSIMQHEGYITVKSKKGSGTEFCIYLPAVMVKDELSPEIKETGHVAGTGNILIVNDEKILCESISDMLTSLGYEVVFSGNGEDAVAYYRKNHTSIDAVVLDLTDSQMSNTDCFQSLQRVNNTIAVVASSDDDDKGKKDVTDNGKIKFIQKPFRIGELSRALAEVLEK